MYLLIYNKTFSIRSQWLIRDKKNLIRSLPSRKFRLPEQPLQASLLWILSRWHGWLRVRFSPTSRIFMKPFLTYQNGDFEAKNFNFVHFWLLEPPSHAFTRWILSHSQGWWSVRFSPTQRIFSKSFLIVLNDKFETRKFYFDLFRLLLPPQQAFFLWF